MLQIAFAAAFILVAGSAHARAPASSAPSCSAVGYGAKRVTMFVANPANCCRGRLQCAQFLSTTAVVRPAHDPRT